MVYPLLRAMFSTWICTFSCKPMRAVKMKSIEKVSLVKSERCAIEKAVRILNKLTSVEKIILFGSKSRGDDDKDSDIDLLLITTVQLSWKDEKAIVDTLFDIGLQYDVIFSPLFVPIDEWEKGLFPSFPIYHEIIKDGAIVR